MKLKTAVLLAAALFSQVAIAQVKEVLPTDTLFNQASIKAVIDMAFHTKSERYTEFATLFNLCQKLPKNPQCGEKYDAKRTNYEVAKANYDVMLMTNDPQFITLMMPPINYEELVSGLKTLGYLSSELEEVEHAQTLDALNEWLLLHSFAKTDEIYFMHALMVRAEELSQQLQVERYTQ
ncbi:hypothetical protein AB4455_08355 [Vibrio sp. 10N.261.46.E12]|uniref:hypothetical protein n=1 Tax=unclassified Vibrio TaxID=2614977 RepID=UPI00097756D6|nr:MULTISPECIES: hypothetical protein [unclassified Vibrio]OMO37649.1 hypothetical protein BH584_21610 [Vibrio sp. 10N.261.45.E1]PMJ19642.1 hypothetical protein BCU27_21115 [Vibrio sp. 10N.286.45.B6]PML93129.1 hypothetical protein BCT66_24740 [Vibrio sp. 10N.261.49.E11]PMM66606.1 hypothetical protein BCT48_16710 [Vibrio sp. 10N.261.46.F12]PMM86340.1 hypothetical protein BCT46_08320 [Vibrio sp. 10N.261.46.E8]